MSDKTSTPAPAITSTTPSKSAVETKAATETEVGATETIINFFKNLALGLAVLSMYFIAIFAAYNIRLYAIKTYGRVIHEFDPW